MSKLFILPNGNAIAPEVIKSVIWHAGKGVICHDAQQRIVVWVPVVDNEKAKRLRDLLIRMSEQGNGSPTPDWSFLNEQEAA